MADFVSRIEIEGLFGRGNVELEFGAGINILTGHNGSLKTTILQVIANILQARFDRFAFLDFGSIRLDLNQGECVRLTRILDHGDVNEVTDHMIRVEWGGFLEVLSTSEIEAGEPSLHKDQPIGTPGSSDVTHYPGEVLPVSYLPAFRTTVEALQSIGQQVSPAEVSDMVRSWLTPFVPHIEYPSLSDVEQALAANTASQRDITRYLRGVNSFLEHKQLIVDWKRGDARLPPVRIEHCDGGFSRLGSLSAGEREIVILLYAAASAGRNRILLIDEPETSLHVAWQRMLLDRMVEAWEYSQVIACTHSPVIASRYSAQQIKFRQVRQRLPDDIPYVF